METILIDFKCLGIPARLNKSDFNPKIHKLWTEEKQIVYDAPLPKKPEHVGPGRPAKIKNAGK